MRLLFLVLTCLTTAVRLAGQFSETPRIAKPMPMPSDRVADSYAIYSQLLKLGPIKGRGVERKQWLIEDTTNAVRLDVDCGAENTDMSPRNAVKAPENRQGEWSEVLADYDHHCHDVIELDRDSFRTDLPVRLLNAEDRRRFNPYRPPTEFADGAGLHQFTEIFFNSNHTLAAVRMGMWCGPTCGNWMWVALERKQGRWEMLPWVYSASFALGNDNFGPSHRGYGSYSGPGAYRGQLGR